MNTLFNKIKVTATAMATAAISTAPLVVVAVKGAYSGASDAIAKKNAEKWVAFRYVPVGGGKSNDGKINVNMMESLEDAFDEMTFLCQDYVKHNNLPEVAVGDVIEFNDSSYILVPGGVAKLTGVEKAAYDKALFSDEKDAIARSMKSMF